MNATNSIIRSLTETWAALQRQNNQSLVNSVLTHIEKQGKLRTPQKEAIETYLWIKFVGNNQRLADIARAGLLFDEQLAREQGLYKYLPNKHVHNFLYHFFETHGLKNLQNKLLRDPDSQQTDWDALLDEFLHKFDYPNYLFSLPMGAGKTFLMACFIYLDLYFASLFKNDKRFAHNFVVFAPQASKTAILPSLRTIKEFNPEWILPKPEADKLRQIISIEILDALSSKRKDKLHGNNPNLEKVNRIKQSKDFGLVFITNAEKVVLEKYDAADQIYLDPQSLYYDPQKACELKKSNELRESLSQIPNLAVILDEVHHCYGKTGNGEKKLRQAVNVLNQHKNVNSVIGLSGTPYVKSKVHIDGQDIRFNQIQDIVYNYPLNIGIGDFLKTPDIRGAGVNDKQFIEQALDDFFADYDIEYADGTKSKVAFYCPSVLKLNEEILPVVLQWYRKNRAAKESEIFRYYSNVDKKNRQYQLPKENLAIFNNLDKPYSDKRVILLVAVGTEGWDCRSLTSVVLPRQKTTKNFVLQTTCRCLREVCDASKEKALIYLSSDNYNTLNQELKENYQLSISDLSPGWYNTINVQVRKPRLGRLNYKQIDTKFKIIKRTSPQIKEEILSFDIKPFKKRFAYDRSVLSGKIGKAGITAEIAVKDVGYADEIDFSYTDFIYELSASTYGLLTPKQLCTDYPQQLKGLYTEIEKNLQWLSLNPYIDVFDVIKAVSACFMDTVEYSKEVIEKQTDIELLEWQSGNEESILRDFQL